MFLCASVGGPTVRCRGVYGQPAGVRLPKASHICSMLLLCTVHCVLCAAGQPDVEAQIDAVMSRFVARANEVRNQLNSQAWSSDKALDEVRQPQGTNRLRLQQPTQAGVAYTSLAKLSNYQATAVSGASMLAAAQCSCRAGAC